MVRWSTAADAHTLKPRHPHHTKQVVSTNPLFYLHPPNPLSNKTPPPSSFHHERMIKTNYNETQKWFKDNGILDLGLKMKSFDSATPRTIPILIDCRLARASHGCAWRLSNFHPLFFCLSSFTSRGWGIPTAFSVSSILLFDAEVELSIFEFDYSIVGRFLRYFFYGRVAWRFDSWVDVEVAGSGESGKRRIGPGISG
jgi:hypothetical protein